MYLNSLRVFVVTEQRLQMLPTIQATDITKLGWHDTLERLGLPIPPNCPLNVCRLYLSAVVNYLTLGRDKRLSHVETIAISFAVSEYYKHSRLLHRGEDTSHLVRVFTHRIGHVVVDDVGVLDNTRSPHRPRLR